MELSNIQGDFRAGRSSNISLPESISGENLSNRRKDSVCKLYFTEGANEARKLERSSGVNNLNIVSGGDVSRRTSRKLSLKPPTDLYREKARKISFSPLSLSSSVPASGFHTVTCDCGRGLTIVCPWAGQERSVTATESVSKLEVTEVGKGVYDNSARMTSGLTATSVKQDIRKLSFTDAIKNMKSKPDDYDTAFNFCVDIGNIEEQDSLDVVLSRQNTVKSLLDAMKQFPKSQELQLKACQCLLKQVQTSEASLQYLSVNNGIEILSDNIKAFSKNIEILQTVLNIFRYFSFQDEWRTVLTQKVNSSDFLTMMARHESDVSIVETCCEVVGNLVKSEDIARSMMYVGGVHSIMSMMTKYNKILNILKHCTTALGTFASHDDTCLAVAEAGAISAVMSVMKSYPENDPIQESCCWALANLSRSNCVCSEPIFEDAFVQLVKMLSRFPMESGIQEYGCWALCNLSVIDLKLEDNDCQSAIEILLTCTVAFKDNVELLEHVFFAINRLVSLRECVHEIVIRLDGVNKLIDVMRSFEDSVDIQTNGCKILGNLAVNAEFRRYIEDIGASEQIIACMLKLDNYDVVQSTGCMSLTNLSADVPDNKFRILANGGVHAALQAMANFKENENVQLSALKLLCNLLESDKGCWRIAEENGIPIISSTLKTFSHHADILSFGCCCLANLPRRGINMMALENAESTFLSLRLSMHRSIEVAQNMCCFYENLLRTSKDCQKLFNQAAMENITKIMREIEDIDVQIISCKIMTLISLGDDMNFITKDVISVLLASMRKYMSNETLQVICCVTISYLTTSAKEVEVLRDIPIIDTIVECMQTHLYQAHIHCACLLAIENICKAGLINDTKIQMICDVVAKSLRAHPDNAEIQQTGSSVLLNNGRKS